MSRILLADDSSHAQRMGERILREEGFEVVSLTDGETVLLRLDDADPDVILADVFLPGKSGFDICRFVKSHPKHRHVRVVMTAGLLEPFDEEEAIRAGCDGILKKPFEASLLMQTIKPLVTEAQLARGLFAEQVQETSKPVAPPRLSKPPPAAPRLEVDPERVHAAITVALDAALPALIHEITERVLIALGH
jgi:CheY-like chemotaxis protein